MPESKIPYHLVSPLAHLDLFNSLRSEIDTAIKVIEDKIKDFQDQVDEYKIETDQKIQDLRDYVESSWQDFSDKIDKNISDIQDHETRIRRLERDFTTLKQNIEDAVATTLEEFSEELKQWCQDYVESTWEDITNRLTTVETNLRGLTSVVTGNFNTLDKKIDDTDETNREWTDQRIIDRVDEINASTIARVSTLENRINATDSTVQAIQKDVTALWALDPVTKNGANKVANYGTYEEYSVNSGNRTFSILSNASNYLKYNVLESVGTLALSFTPSYTTTDNSGKVTTHPMTGNKLFTIAIEGNGRATFLGFSATDNAQVIWVGEPLTSTDTLSLVTAWMVESKAIVLTTIAHNI